MRQVIRGAEVFCADGSFRVCDVAIADGVIAEIGAGLSGEGVDATGQILTAGLIDIHTHGAVGADASDGDADGMQRIAAYECSAGVTSFFPTTVALSEADLQAAMCALRPLINQTQAGHATMRGINMEGPFFNAEKKGAHEAHLLRDFDIAMFLRLQEAAGGHIRFVDGAPELPSGLEFIRALAPDVVFSLAHTMANYEQATAAFEAGARHVTHLFNAMPSYLHREPGVIGAAMERAAHVELICDGLHVHPAVIRNCFAQFGARLCMISDSMRGTGMPDGSYQLGGLTVTLEGTTALLADGTLAGSATNLAECLRRTIALGVPRAAALQAATINPARAAGIERQTGSIEVGKDADLVLWNHEFYPQRTWVRGL